ncbi:MAG: hypothetical protein JW841_18375 [Deltaproteobacteria bacterium]|nr:hypothetical protein [Deltaproteobacteria bacterium]
MRVFITALLLIIFSACKPELGEPASLIQEPAILAVRGIPAEAAPLSLVSYEVLVATPDGSMLEVAADWALCKTAKPPSEPGPISEACLTDGVSLLAEATSNITAEIPYDACQLFGPDVPPQSADEPPGRPRDPDVTGGYYQPVRVTIPTSDGDMVAFGFERISCNPGNAAIDVALQYKEQYQPNNAPELSSVWAKIDGKEQSETTRVIDGVVPDNLLHVPRHANITLGVSWPQEAVETFPVYNLTTQKINQTREAMRVSWFSNAGQWAHDRTGRDSNASETWTSNNLTTPSTSGLIHIWAVLRDNRGGVDWLETVLMVD